MYGLTKIEGIVMLHAKWHGCGYRLRRLQMHPMAIYGYDPADHVVLRGAWACGGQMDSRLKLWVSCSVQHALYIGVGYGTFSAIRRSREVSWLAHRACPAPQDRDWLYVFQLSSSHSRDPATNGSVSSSQNRTPRLRAAGTRAPSALVRRD